MECTTAYPSQASQISLNLIKEYIDRFPCLVGISDHSATIYPGIAAVAVGARCVEVHVTMSHEMFGPDVPASISTSELSELVKGVHFVDEMKQCTIDKKALSESVQNLRNTFSKCLYANDDICRGEILTVSKVGIKKPFNEEAVRVEDYYSIIGTKTKVDIKKDDIIKWEYIQ
jgi:N-acetylneuraminate synthase